jgi:hypothetical protein
MQELPLHRQQLWNPESFEVKRVQHWKEDASKQKLEVLSTRASHMSNVVDVAAWISQARQRSTQAFMHAL